MLAEPGGGILETLLSLVTNVASESVPASLMPDQSLLIAIRDVEGAEWSGIPAELNDSASQKFKIIFLLLFRCR